jgi:hypothetical protein
MKKLIACLALVFAACGDDSTSLDLSNTQIELDVFSGRPNPTWSLTSAEADALETRLADLPRAAGPVPEGTLGYRGFIVRDGILRIEIGRGLVIVRRGDATEIYQDQHHAENHLFQQAVQRGYGGLIAAD